MALFADGSLCGGKASDRYTVGRAGNIVKTYVVAELNRGGISAVFTAYSEMDIRTGLATELGSHLYELADTLLVKLFKVIGLIDVRVGLRIEGRSG